MTMTMKKISLVAATMAIMVVVALITPGISYQSKQYEDRVEEIGKGIGYDKDDNIPTSLPSTRVSRFLDESFPRHGRILKAADHCHKDNEICDAIYGANSTCCSNKCFNLGNDKAHCGACHNKCKFTNSCCGGKCVDLSYDKRHCGSCNNKCLPGQYCIYGMCDYA